MGAAAAANAAREASRSFPMRRGSSAGNIATRDGLVAQAVAQAQASAFTTAGPVGRWQPARTGSAGGNSDAATPPAGASAPLAGATAGLARTYSGNSGSMYSANEGANSSVANATEGGFFSAISKTNSAYSDKGMSGYATPVGNLSSQEGSAAGVKPLRSAVPAAAAAAAATVAADAAAAAGDLLRPATPPQHDTPPGSTNKPVSL